MKSTGLALIDITAEGKGRRLVPASAVIEVGQSLAVKAKSRPAELSDGMKSAVEKLLGPQARPTLDEFATLTRALAALPPVAPRQSFVWSAVNGAADVERLIRAVVVYHRFNIQAVEISERIGANDDFRRFVRQCSMPEDTELKEALEGERRHVDRISAFMETVTAFVEKAAAVFDGRNWDIGAVLVLTGAVGGLVHSREVLVEGWDLLQTPSDMCLDTVEGLRMELAYLSREINDSHGVNLIDYADSSLAGIRRALFDGGADFRAALATFGIEEEEEAGVIRLATLAKSYLETYDKLVAAIEENGYRETDMPSLVSQVLLRKYFKAAAEAIGVDWLDVAETLTPRAVVSAQAMRTLIDALDADNFSAKLDNISRDRGQAIVNVVLAAEHYVYTRQYWIDAGDRVVSCDPGIRLMDVRSILEMEPEIQGSTEILSKVGAIDRMDIGALENHLDWLVGVYGLPVPNAAITKVIETFGDVLDGFRVSE